MDQFLKKRKGEKREKFQDLLYFCTGAKNVKKIKTNKQILCSDEKPHPCFADNAMKLVNLF